MSCKKKHECGGGKAHPSHMKILLVPGNLASLALQFFAPKHLVRAKTFPPSLLAPTTSPMFSRDNDDVLLALRLLCHETPCAKRKTLEAKPRGIDIARCAAARTGGVCARHGRLKATQQARHAHLFVSRRVRQRRVE